MTGTLYGVGVGPGAPDLITLRAFRILTGAPVIAYPAPDNGESFARSIVAGMIRKDHIEIPIVVPMRVERYPAAEVYDQAAKVIGQHLQDGRDVAVLCEGDPFFYGSFMYLFERLSADHTCEIVPGVSSLGGAAGALALPLTARNDVLTVLPGPLGDKELADRIGHSDVTVIMKIGRHFERIFALLERLGLLNVSHYAERVTLEDREIVGPLSDFKGHEAPYFSIIIIQRNSSLVPGEAS